jgi:hypothetical protein
VSESEGEREMKKKKNWKEDEIHFGRETHSHVSK